MSTDADELPIAQRGGTRLACDDPPWSWDLDTGEELDPSPLAVPELEPAETSGRGPSPPGLP